MFFLLQILHHGIPSIAFSSFLAGILNRFLTFFHPKHKKVGCLSCILNRTKVIHIDLVWQIYHFPRVNTFYETICYNSYREYNHIYQEPLSISHTCKQHIWGTPRRDLLLLCCKNSSLLRPEQWRWCQTLQILQHILSPFFTSELHLQHFVLSEPIIIQQ